MKVFDIILMYWSMLGSFILKLPYWLKNIIELSLLWIILGVMCSIIFCFFIKFLLPLLLTIGTLLISGLLYINLLLFHKIFQCESLSAKTDEIFNKIGITLNDIKLKIKEKTAFIQFKSLIKKFLFSKFYFAVLILVILVTLPYYFQDSAGDNAKQAFHQISTFISKMEQLVFKDMDKYYKEKEDTEETNPNKTPGKGKKEKEEKKIVLRLSPDGIDGANIRSTPDKDKDDNIITTVSGDDKMTYLHEYAIIDDVYWLKVRTESNEDGWISSKLIRKKDLKRIDIFTVKED